MTGTRASDSVKVAAGGLPTWPYAPPAIELLTLADTETAWFAWINVPVAPSTFTTNGVAQFAAVNEIRPVSALNWLACPALAADNTSPVWLADKVTETTSPAEGAWVSATE